VTNFTAYQFRPSRYSPQLGHNGLDIELKDASGQATNIACSATFRVLSSGLSYRTIRNSRSANNPRRKLRVAVGNFRIDTIPWGAFFGFSFGGWLVMTDRDAYTACQLTSPAPVFELAEELDTEVDFVVATLLALLARHRAGWLRDDVGYEHWLATVDPFQLFKACLASLRSHFSNLEKFGHEYRAGAKWVRQAIDILGDADEWQEPVADLIEIT
jgi:hypothetical protein